MKVIFSCHFIIAVKFNYLIGRKRRKTKKKQQQKQQQKKQDKKIFPLGISQLYKSITVFLYLRNKWTVKTSYL